MATTDMDKIDVCVYDKVREYYKTDKYLGRLIKVFRTVHFDRLSRTVAIIIPKLEREDIITINGIEYSPTNKRSNKLGEDK